MWFIPTLLYLQNFTYIDSRHVEQAKHLSQNTVHVPRFVVLPTVYNLYQPIVTYLLCIMVCLLLIVLVHVAEFISNGGVNKLNHLLHEDIHTLLTNSYFARSFPNQVEQHIDTKLILPYIHHIILTSLMLIAIHQVYHCSFSLPWFVGNTPTSTTTPLLLHHDKIPNQSALIYVRDLYSVVYPTHVE